MDLTIEQVARELQVSKTLVYRLARTKKIRAYKIGLQGRTSNWRIPETAVEDYRHSAK